MSFQETFLDGVTASVAYAAVGVVLMGLGFVMVDLLLPGQLRTQIWTDRNPNAALVLASGLLGTAVVVITAILTSFDNLADGLASTAVYGLLGLGMMALAFAVVDVLTPGRLGETLTESTLHPAAWVTATVHLAIGGIIAAAIS